MGLAVVVSITEETYFCQENYSLPDCQKVISGHREKDNRFDEGGLSGIKPKGSKLKKKHIA